MSPHIAMGIILFTGMANAIFMLTLLPLMFWIFVVPKIENRVGHKLKFHPQYEITPFGKYFVGPVELGCTIALMYLNFKIFNDTVKIKFDKTRALANANYDVKTASKIELIMSFVCFFCMILFITSLLLMFLIPIMFPLK